MKKTVCNNCHAELVSASHELEIPNQLTASPTHTGSQGSLRCICSLCKVRNDRRVTAFTLAEVLITLTIIGVIAALTIPNLMQSWRKHERITQIKTAYSIIQNATKMAVAEHGNPDGWDFNQSSSYAEQYFIPYVKTQKLCGRGTDIKVFITEGCFETRGDNLDNGTWNLLNGDSYGVSGGYGTQTYYTMILQNGMHVAVWAAAKQNQHANTPVVFLVDVNGKQGPSALGKDIFTFSLKPYYGKLATGGNNSNYNENDCVLTGKGTSCAYWIERNHWEFPDDYPVKKF